MNSRNQVANHRAALGLDPRAFRPTEKPKRLGSLAGPRVKPEGSAAFVAKEGNRHKSPSHQTAFGQSARLA